MVAQREHCAMISLSPWGDFFLQVCSVLHCYTIRLLLSRQKFGMPTFRAVVLQRGHWNVCAFCAGGWTATACDSVLIMCPGSWRWLFFSVREGRRDDAFHRRGCNAAQLYLYLIFCILWEIYLPTLDCDYIYAVYLLCFRTDCRAADYQSKTVFLQFIVYRTLFSGVFQQKLLCSEYLFTLSDLKLLLNLIGFGEANNSSL